MSSKHKNSKTDNTDQKGKAVRRSRTPTGIDIYMWLFWGAERHISRNFYLQVERAEQGDSDPASWGSTGKVLILGYGARLLRVVLTSFFFPGE